MEYDRRNAAIVLIESEGFTRDVPDEVESRKSLSSNDGVWDYILKYVGFRSRSDG